LHVDGKASIDLLVTNVLKCLSEGKSDAQP
jgi:hypothetical protein